MFCTGTTENLAELIIYFLFNICKLHYEALKGSNCSTVLRISSRVDFNQRKSQKCSKFIKQYSTVV